MLDEAAKDYSAELQRYDAALKQLHHHQRKIEDLLEQFRAAIYGTDQKEKPDKVHATEKSK